MPQGISAVRLTNGLYLFLLHGLCTMHNTIPAMPTVPQSYLHYKQSQQQAHNNVNLYVKKAAPVISPHCTNTRHSYTFHFCAVTQQSDVLFAFSVHVNGTIRPDGEKTFQSAHILS